MEPRVLVRGVVHYEVGEHADAPTMGFAEEAFEVFDDLPAIRPETVERARRTVREWEQKAVAELDELDAGSGEDARALHTQQLRTLMKAASSRELADLVETGLLPEQALSSTGTAQVDRPR